LFNTATVKLYRWSGTVEFGMQQLDFPLLTLGYGFVSLIYLILGTTTLVHVASLTFRCYFERCDIIGKCTHTHAHTHGRTHVHMKT
jgi:hypothetical protein